MNLNMRLNMLLEEEGKCAYCGKHEKTTYWQDRVAGRWAHLCDGCLERVQADNAVSMMRAFHMKLKAGQVKGGN